MKILTIFIIIVLAVVVFLFYMGAFSKVSIKMEKKGPYTYVYADHTGDYSKVGELMAKLDKEIRAVGFNSAVGIGVYYDDPKKVAKENLRSEVGSVITVEDLPKIEAQKNNFNFNTVEEKEYLVAEFPYRNMLSFVFGVMKVYPAMSKYIEENKYEMQGPSIELYDMANKKMYYLMDVKK